MHLKKSALQQKGNLVKSSKPTEKSNKLKILHTAAYSLNICRNYYY